jgi:hypothetical protein
MGYKCKVLLTVSYGPGKWTTSECQYDIPGIYLCDTENHPLMQFATFETVNFPSLESKKSYGGQESVSRACEPPESRPVSS